MHTEGQQDAAWVLPMSSPLRCTSPADVYLLLKSSDFISHDLDPEMIFQYCEERPQAYKLELVLRKWYPVDRVREFRCFVRQEMFLGIWSDPSSSARVLTTQTSRYFPTGPKLLSISERVGDGKTNQRNNISCLGREREVQLETYAREL